MPRNQNKPPDFADILKELMRSKKLTSQDLSGLTGIARSTIVKWRSGHAKPNYDALYQLSMGLNIPVDRLFGIAPEQRTTDMDAPGCTDGKKNQCVRDAIKERREACGMSQFALGKTANVGRSTVSMFEIGGNTTLNNVERMAAALGMEIIARKRVD